MASETDRSDWTDRLLRTVDFSLGILDAAQERTGGFVSRMVGQGGTRRQTMNDQADRFRDRGRSLRAQAQERLRETAGRFLAESGILEEALGRVQNRPSPPGEGTPEPPPS